MCDVHNTSIMLYESCIYSHVKQNKQTLCGAFKNNTQNQLIIHFSTYIIFNFTVDLKQTGGGGCVYNLNS